MVCSRRQVPASKIWRTATRVWVALAFSLLASTLSANPTGFAGRNVNVAGSPAPGSAGPADVGLRQQNEPSCGVNPANPLQICCGFNDYRGIDVPEIADAWQGLACSTDGGLRWHSELVPGHGADTQYSLNVDFAADPNVVSVPGGLFFNFIAADRADHTGGIYLQRYAWRNREDGWPLRQVGGPLLISKGTNGRFIDKPHMIGFLDDNSAADVTMTWDDEFGAASRNLPAGNLGMAAAIFVGNDNNDGTKVLYWSSDNWGASWRHPTKLTESVGVNSGVNLAANGDNVCAVWRRFDDVNESNSILYACSSNRGKTFGKPKLIADMCPFDQTTLSGKAPQKNIVSFRSNAFPVIAGDGDNFYVFWSDRGYAAASNFEAGCELITESNEFNPSYGRIVYSFSGNGGKSWSAPQVVEDAPLGHQFMPAAFGAAGEVVLSFIDNRDDIANFLDIDKQLIVDLWKDDEALYRHTVDMRGTRIVRNGGRVDFTPSIKVSRYRSGLIRQGTSVSLRQMEYNLVNARLFQQGTAPFIGDYPSVTAAAYSQNASGRWVNSNTAPPGTSPVFHISFGDNRDVRGNAWGSANSEGFDGPSPYTPTAPNTANAQTDPSTEVPNTSPSVGDPPDNQQIFCEAAPTPADRTRDQNVYSVPLYPQTILRSPGAVKVTGELQRALPLYLQNYSLETRYFRLLIESQPSDYGACTGVASFRQFPPAGEESTCPAVASTALWVKVYPRSAAVRTIFQTSATDTLPVISVSASACQSTNGVPDENDCELASRIVLNQDPLEAGGTLEQPDSSTASIFDHELHDPLLLNPDLVNPDLLRILLENPGLLSAGTLNPDLLDPNILPPALLELLLAYPDVLVTDILNALIETPDLLDPAYLGTVVAAPDLLNPDLLNLMVANPDLLNTITQNPDLLNPDLLNLLIEAGDLTAADLQALAVANPDLLNPDLLNLLVANPDLLNPDLLNPDLLNPDLLNPDLLNPDLLNLVMLNPDLLNPDLLNPDLLNPDLINPDLINPDLLNQVLRL